MFTFIYTHIYVYIMVEHKRRLESLYYAYMYVREYIIYSITISLIFFTKY